MATAVELMCAIDAETKLQALQCHLTVVQARCTTLLEEARAARRETRATALMNHALCNRLLVLTDALVEQLSVFDAEQGWFCSWCEANADDGAQCAATFAEVEHDDRCPLAEVPS